MNTEGYIGNIWGKRVTLYSLLFIIFVFAVMLARYSYLKSNGLYPIEQEQQEQIIEDEH